jgi:hypothetical protein
VNLIVQGLYPKLHSRGAKIEHALYLLLPTKVRPGLDAQSHTAMPSVFIKLPGFLYTARGDAVQSIIAILNKLILIVPGIRQKGAPHDEKLYLILGMSHFSQCPEPDLRLFFGIKATTSSSDHRWRLHGIALGRLRRSGAINTFTGARKWLGHNCHRGYSRNSSRCFLHAISMSISP